MDTDDDELERRRDELRRMVFGAPGGAEAVVVAELIALEAEIKGRDRATQPRQRDGSSGADGLIPDAARPALRVQSAVAATHQPDGTYVTRRVGGVPWTLVFVLIAAAIAGVIVLDPARALLSPPRGLEVLERAPSALVRERAEDVSAAAHLDAAASLSLRPVGRAVGYEFWAYREGGGVCLLSQRDYWFAWVSSCVTIEEFLEHGLVRRIPADEISDVMRPSHAALEDVVLVEWGPRSVEVEWRVVPAGEPPG